MSLLTKRDVIRLLETIATYLELKGENSFKISAYRRAANVLDTVEKDLREIDDFTSLNGIGKGTAQVIEEYIKEQKSSVLEELKKEVPAGLILLLQIPGLGGKKISKLHKELGIENVDDLKRACLSGQVRNLTGFGQKTEEKILAALENRTRPPRLPIAYMLKIAEFIEGKLTAIDGIEKFSRAGSLRRVRETVKDLDFILSTNQGEHVKEQLLKLPNIKERIAVGDTKISLIFQFEYEVSVDFRIVRPQEFATALHHFTGSKDHNIRMRQLAKDRGEKISEYGVELEDSGEILTFPDEQAFFQHFGLPFIPPEMRESGREVDEYSLDLGIVKSEDIRGDLHMHTTWSDGANDIEEMIEACLHLGYEYMAITDHSKFLKVANGLDEERLLRQREKIAKLNEKYKDITILAGIEMDILPDGSLDFSNEVLKEMDFVIASIHSAFSQPRETIMERIRTAMHNPYVNMIAHPTGRKIGIREGYAVDIDELIQLAKETGTALELNANPNRLDLQVVHLEKAQKAGVKVFINTDAHSKETLSNMKIGVQTARKAWIKRENVLNSFSIDSLLSFLRSKKV